MDIFHLYDLFISYAALPEDWIYFLNYIKAFISANVSVRGYLSLFVIDYFYG